jgi:CRP-like cAMP-binding protein
MKRSIEISLDVAEPGKPPGQRLSADELAAIPLFATINKKVLARNEGAVVRRRYRKGDIICREGEFGSTAFLIEQGSVNVFIRSPIKHVRNQRGGLVGWFRRIKVNLVGRAEDARDEESKAKFIPIDAPVWLSYENPVASLAAGQMFGEMTCMSSYPRFRRTRRRRPGSTPPIAAARWNRTCAACRCLLRWSRTRHNSRGLSRSCVSEWNWFGLIRVR